MRSLSFLILVFTLKSFATSSPAHMVGDDELRKLSETYVHAFNSGDISKLDQIATPNFIRILNSGTSLQAKLTGIRKRGPYALDEIVYQEREGVPYVRFNLRQKEGFLSNPDIWFLMVQENNTWQLDSISEH